VEYCYLVSPSEKEKYLAGGIAFIVASSLSLYRLHRRSDFVKRLLGRRVK